MELELLQSRIFIADNINLHQYSTRACKDIYMGGIIVGNSFSASNKIITEGIVVFFEHTLVPTSKCCI